jgi:hypothetical protein
MAIIRNLKMSVETMFTVIDMATARDIRFYSLHPREKPGSEKEPTN